MAKGLMFKEPLFKAIIAGGKIETRRVVPRNPKNILFFFSGGKFMCLEENKIEIKEG